MVDVVLHSVRVFYRINKGESDDPPPVPTFRRDAVNVYFLIYSKKTRLSSSHVGIRNIPSDVSYDDKKHYQV